MQCADICSREKHIMQNMSAQCERKRDICRIARAPMQSKRENCKKKSLILLKFFAIPPPAAGTGDCCLYCAHAARKKYAQTGV